MSNAVLTMTLLVCIFAVFFLPITLLGGKTAELMGKRQFYGLLNRQITGLCCLAVTIAGVLLTAVFFGYFLGALPLTTDILPQAATVTPHTYELTSVYQLLATEAQAVALIMAQIASVPVTVLRPMNSIGLAQPSWFTHILWAFCISLAFLVALLWIIRFSWKKLHQSTVHWLLSLVAAGLSLSVLGAAIFYITSIQDGANQSLRVAIQWLNSSFPACAYHATTDLYTLIHQCVYECTMPIGTTILPMGVLVTANIITISLLLALSGVLTCCWVIIRRNADDYGRDYYSFALPTTARFALYPALISLLAQSYLNISFIVVTTEQRLPKTGYISLTTLLATCILLFCLQRSHMPLRHKASGIAALPLLIAAAVAAGINQALILPLWP